MRLQRCWEFYQTLLRYRAVDRTCELLCMLFDEAYDTADFDFVVQCRDLVMSVTDSDATDLTSLMLPTGMCCVCWKSLCCLLTRT